jgi:hypothetical protein
MKSSRSEASVSSSARDYRGCSRICGEQFHYAPIWNSLDQPAITSQAGLKVDPTVEVTGKDYRPRSADDEREYRGCEHDVSTVKEFADWKTCRQPRADCRHWKALPLVGKHFRDEVTVAAAEAVVKTCTRLKMMRED